MPSSVADHDGPLARAHAVHPCQARGAAAEHHARQVVAGEHAVLLGRARRHDHPSRMHMHELAVRRERHVRPLVDPERGEPLQHRDVSSRPNVGRELGDAVAVGPGAIACADRHSSRTSTVPPAPASRRGIEPGDAGADHEHVGVLVADDLRVAAVVGGRAPSPVARRITRSAIGHANRGRTNVL